MPPDLHFDPVSDLRKTATRMTDPKIVHPTSKDGIDLLNHFSHGLADVLPKDFPELGKERRSFLHLRHELRSPLLVTAQNQAIFKSQEPEAFAFSQIDCPTLVFVDLDS
jgi:hypothetical protein